MKLKYLMWGPPGPQTQGSHTRAALGAPETHPPPYSLQPAASPLGSVSHKTQTGVAILLDKELLAQLFLHFGRFSIGVPVHLAEKAGRPAWWQSLT